MNLSPAPNTPIRTPQPRSSTKALQLTPIWEEVIKNNRLPSDVNQELIFNEISVRLEDLEWPVRLHALRVLCDVIPVVSRERLDERITQNNILTKLIVNLGHPAPGIRKVASETLQKYLKRTQHSEKMLQNLLELGILEKHLSSNDQAGILRENITLGTILALVDVLKPFAHPENGGYCLSQALLTDAVDALVLQAKRPVYREKCLETLWKVKDLVGETRFSRSLDGLQGREEVMNMMNLKEEGQWREKSSFGVLTSEDSFDLPPPEEGRGGRSKRNSSSEDFSDGSDTETYTKEPAPILDDDSVYYHVHRAEISPFVPGRFVPIEPTESCLSGGDAEEATGKESRSSSPRVVLEAEIQFAKNKAITMKVVEDDEEQSESQKRFTTEDGDLVMKVLDNSEDIAEEEKTRTPRRVRFGGEVIKLRTPDSETTDITIEIHEAGGGPTGKEPAITFTPETTPQPPETKTLIPLPLPPPSRAPSRDSSPSRRPQASKAPPLKEASLAPRKASFDSAPSSSGSDADAIDKGNDDDDEGLWKWAEMHLVEENILKDLKNKENWKIQYQALEQLKIVLISPKTIERLEKMKNQEKLNSLFRCLVHKLPLSSSHQVTTLALSIVSQLIETLPKELILQEVQDIVQGLCRYVGGSRNLNLKIEAVQSLKTLFGTLEPSAVTDVLIGNRCLFSSNSKLRENSLLAIMYATMTFPSDMFDVEKILVKVAASAADARRRVRHASLEAIAVLSQFSSSQTLAESVARVADSLPSAGARAQLVAAVQARLSRRVLPTVSTEGLVLYGLQIPASRRFGNTSNPLGADVDWILSGTGSVSTGSAKCKTQLNAAQRLEIKPPISASSSKWTPKDQELQPLPKPPPAGNPWKIQKHRTESSAAEDNPPQETFYKAHSVSNLSGPLLNQNFRYNDLRLRPEEVTWALVPISALDEPHLGRERSSSLWSESLEESPFGPLRPMYLRLHPGHEQLILSRSSDDLRRNPYSHGEKKTFQDFTEVRLLTPTILREKSCSENFSPNKKFQKAEAPTRIPVLCPSSAKSPSKPLRVALSHDRRTSEPEAVSLGSQKIGAIPNGFNGTAAFLPSIHAGQKSPTGNKFEDVNEAKLQDTMAQLSGLLTTSKAAGKPGARDPYVNKPQPELPTETAESIGFEDKIQNKLFDRNFLKNRETLPNTIASAPPVINTDSRDNIPSTSSSNSTDFGTLSGSELRLRRLRNGSGALDHSSDLSYRNYSTYNPKVKGKKVSLGKNLQSKAGINGNAFPDSLKPFERPKEGCETCLNQLESQQWEVNMLGLTSLVRLLRHHPAIVLGQLHPVIVALGRQIRNLRSQVARVACQASAEMFLALKRNVEPDLEELSGPLFHRTADTNRFIRADCNHALDNMVDSVGHAKAVTVIISKGTTHQNAAVRTVAARLLLRLSEKAGAEKLLSLPKETRDKMLQAGANLLMEGKLETRAFAKQVFRVWSSHSSFPSLILEAVPPNIMRHISKTLISLKS